MAKMIQIRHVPDEVHGVLKARASTAGRSLSDYLREMITEAAARPTVEEVLERAARAGGPVLSQTDIVEAIREGRAERDQRWEKATDDRTG